MFNTGQQVSAFYRSRLNLAAKLDQGYDIELYGIYNTAWGSEK